MIRPVSGKPVTHPCRNERRKRALNLLTWQVIQFEDGENERRETKRGREGVGNLEQKIKDITILKERVY